MRSKTAQDDPLVVPSEYCGIPFTVWLDIFLEYGVALSRNGDIEAAYEIIAAAFHANVFYHSTESLFQIHVCWFSKFQPTFCNVED